MDTSPRLVDIPAVDTDAMTQAKPAIGERASAAVAYVHDSDSARVVSRCFADLSFTHGSVVTGGLDTAIKELSQRGWPRFLIVDISGTSDPLPQINRLAEICDPATEVIVIGERNDIVLYRDLKAAGVAEYFYKPVLGDLLARAIVGIRGGAANLQPSRIGKLIFFVGVRGGVGTTTIATNLAWYFAEVRQRGVLLLDLDLHAGDAALQLGVQPTHALREALDDPTRIDELFLERGVVPVTSHLGLLAGLEPLSDRMTIDEEAFLALLQKLLARFRYVLVDVLGEVARLLPTLLHLPASLVLVSDGTLTSLREVGRWREFVGPNRPDRMLLHVLNRKNADGALPEQEMLRVIPAPDVSIRWDREVMSAAALGTKALQGCSAIREAMAALSVQLTGAVAEDDQPLYGSGFSVDGPAAPTPGRRRRCCDRRHRRAAVGVNRPDDRHRWHRRAVVGRSHSGRCDLRRDPGPDRAGAGDPHDSP